MNISPKNRLQDITNMKDLHGPLCINKHLMLFSHKNYNLAQMKLFVDISKSENIDHFKVLSKSLVCSFQLLKSTDKSGDTLLHILAKSIKTDLSIAKKLLEHGIDMSLKNQEGKTAWDIAIENEKYDLYLFMEMYGEDPSIGNWISMFSYFYDTHDSETALTYATKMIKRTGDLTNLTGQNIAHLLALSTRSAGDYLDLKDEILIDQLVANKVDICAADDEGITPLALGHRLQKTAFCAYLANQKPYQKQICEAIDEKDLAMVQSLFDCGMRIDVRDEYQDTLLHRGLADVDTVELLLENGADIHATGYFDITPLQETIGKDLPETAQLLVAHGAQLTNECIEQIVASGYTEYWLGELFYDELIKTSALCIAARIGSSKLMEEFIHEMTLEDLCAAKNHGNGSFEFMIKRAKAPFSEALDKKDVDGVHQLITFGFDPTNFVTDVLDTGHDELISFVLKHCKSIDSDHLMGAMSDEDLNLVKVLVEAGIEIDGEMIEYAMGLDDHDILTYLLENCKDIDSKHLMDAIRDEDLNLVKVLVEAGIEIDGEMIEYAKRLDGQDILSYLLRERGSDVTRDS